MLRNIVGEDALPSKVLIEDLHALCSIGPDATQEVARLLPLLLSEDSDEAATADAVDRLEKVGVDSETAQRILRVSVFLSKQSARNKLTKSSIIQDLRSISGVDEESIDRLEPVLSAMESNRDGVALTLARRSALRTGLPRIESATCEVDARTIFRSDKHDSEDDSYFAIEQLLPLVVLEIVSELNDNKQTHSFVLTEKHLTQLCDILTRTQRRLQSLKSAIPPELLEGKGMS